MQKRKKYLEMMKMLFISIKKWWTRPRTGYIFGLTNWIISSSKALTILFVISYSFAFLFFGVLAFIFRFYAFPKWLFIIFSLLSLFKLFKLIRIITKTGITEVFGGLGAKDLVLTKDDSALRSE